MNTAIFNRTGGTAAPAPGARQWARIESAGEHPAVLRGADGTPEPVVQVLDGEAFAAMVEDFRNRREAAGAGWGGMLVDLDHLSHDPAHDTQAQAWLHDLRIEGGHLMGLLEGLQAAAMLLPRPMESPNASVETDLAGLPRAFRDRLADRMQGLAEWDGDTLRMTDPNGTRPYTAAALAEVWARPLPERFHDLPGEGQMQREALRLWAEDHTRFQADTDHPRTSAGRLDAFEDVTRAFMRVEPMPAGSTVWRGLSWNRFEGDKPWKGFRSFLDELEESGYYTPDPAKPADSWSVAESGARKYASARRFQVTMVCRKARTARDIGPLVRMLRKGIASPDPAHPVETDGEAVFLNGTRFRVVRIEINEQTRNGGRATVYVEEE